MVERPFDAIDGALPASTLLLEASAGTGKTWSLTTIATRLLLEGQVASVRRLLVVTFTRAATHELRERLRERLRDARDVLRGCDPGDDAFLRTLVGREDRAAAAKRLSDALTDYDLVRVSTIHGFCARLLQDTAFEAGLAFDAEEVDDPSRLRTAALGDAWRAIVEGGPAWRAAWAQARRFDFDAAAGDLDLALRQRGAEHRPRVDSLESFDARLATAWAEVFDDPDRRDAIATFLEATPTKQNYRAERVAALGARLRRGPCPPTVDAWCEVAEVLPSRVEEAVGARGLKIPSFNGFAAALQDLDEALAGALAALRTAVLDEALTRFERAKQAAGLRDFDDMISQTRARLEDPDRGPALVERVRAEIDTALIDEFQDTDSDQYAIFRILFGDRRTIMVGDPKQAIYGFRGADVFAYFRAREEAREKATLPENHRSHPQLVRAVNRLFAESPDAFALDDLRVEPVEPARTEHQRRLEGDDGPALQFAWIDRDAVVASELARTGRAPERKPSASHYLAAATECTVDAIAHLLARGITIDGRALNPGDVAVLTRKHGESRRVHDALRRAGIDAVIAGSGDVRRTDVFADWVRILDAVVDPSDPRRLRRALATRVWGATVSELAALTVDADAAVAAVETFESLHRTWQRHGVFAVLARVVVERAVEDRWLAEDDGERAVTDLRHAMEFVHTFATERGLRPEALVHALWRQHDRPAPQGPDDEATRLRLERDERAVKIVTMHTSKGLEYDVVVVPFAWNPQDTKAPWLYHDGEARVVDWDDDRDTEGARRARAEALAEEMRLLYVALTRASRRCLVIDTDFVTPKLAERKLAPLHFLLHRPPREPDEPVVAWIGRLMKSMAKDRTGWREHLETLCATADVGWLDTTTPPADTGGADRDDDAVVEPTPRPAPATIRDRLRPWTVTSFTALARGVHDTGDRLREREDPEAAAAPVDATPEGLFAFARGARAGNCLHEVLELSAFDADPDDPAHRAELERILRRHDLFDPARHVARIDPLDEVARLVRTVGGETFPGAGAPFASIPRARRLNEWEFRLPVERVDLRALADAVERHAPAEFGPAFAERLRTHREPQRGGLFGGVVDLVFELDGRYRIVDWKSNHLGNTAAAYDRPAMHAAMLEHDYYLQMLLYQVALHRHLRSRLADYDYDAYCGGAAYAFLRGLDGTGTHGWIDWRPARQLVDAVDACFRTPRLGRTS